MLALFSRFVSWLRLDGVRALKPSSTHPPQRKVIISPELADTELLTLECGHTILVHRHRIRQFPCQQCLWLQNANAGKPQPVSTDEGSGKT